MLDPSPEPFAGMGCTLFRNLKELLHIQKSKNEKALCMVVSEQEGAEIWIDGKITSYRTPKLVAIAKDKDILVEVRQVGHEPHRTWVRSTHNLSFHYCNLKRIPLRIVEAMSSQSL